MKKIVFALIVIVILANNSHSQTISFRFGGNYANYNMSDLINIQNSKARRSENIKKCQNPKKKKVLAPRPSA